MKRLACFLLMTALIAVACAHPADDAVTSAASAASTAAKNATTVAPAAADAASKAAHDAKGKGVNPLDFAAQVSKFMSTISEACQKFIQGIFKGHPGSAPGAVPGIDDISKIPKLFNPFEIGKDALDNVLKSLGGETTPKSPAAADANSTTTAAKAAADSATSASPADKNAKGGKGVIESLGDGATNALKDLFDF